ncbi:MAG: hypothetical protein IPL27_27755 [Lewinellaceae bacterium]|nr:hypothetical protein [Lewinellaceae bacterium]
MPHHIGIGKIDADKIRLMIPDILDDSRLTSGALISGWKIVGGYFGDADHYGPPSPSKGSSRPSGKKKVTCGYFSRFGNAHLACGPSSK